MTQLCERPSYRYGTDDGPRSSFAFARQYVRGLGKYFDLECIEPGIYIVTRYGSVVGKGLHPETAIADYESNL
jgi:hypothetical protein